jgi:hypothetical protein
MILAQKRLNGPHSRWGMVIMVMMMMVVVINE